MLEVKKTSDIKSLTKIKVIVYGTSGSGKTMLTATCPKPLLISCEKGHLSLNAKNIAKVYGNETLGITYDIPYVEISNFNDFVQVFNAIEQDNGKTFETVVFDSISDLSEIVLEHAKPKYKDGRMAYGEMANTMTSIIRKFRDSLDIHVVFLAKQAKIKDGETGRMKYAPMFPGTTLNQTLIYLPDEIFYLGVKYDSTTNTSYRYLQTQPDAEHESKDRSGRLEIYEAPHLGEIFNKIKGV